MGETTEAGPGERHPRPRKVSVCSPLDPSEGFSPADALMSERRPPELCESALPLFQPPQFIQLQETADGKSLK